MAKMVSFAQLDREHRRSVARDDKRVRSGQASAASVQAENSILPPNTRVRIPNFLDHAKQAYLRK